MQASPSHQYAKVVDDHTSENYPMGQDNPASRNTKQSRPLVGHAMKNVSKAKRNWGNQRNAMQITP